MHKLHENCRTFILQPSKVRNYIGLNIVQLADLLQLEMAKYSKFIADGKVGTDQFIKCRNIIEDIQAAIQSLLKSRLPVY